MTVMWPDLFQIGRTPKQRHRSTKSNRADSSFVSESLASDSSLSADARDALT